MLSRQMVAFSFPAYRRLWLASLGYALSVWMERVAIGWFVFDFTGSVFLAALSFAAQNLSNMLFGPLAGAVADRVNRSRLLALTGLLGGFFALMMGLVVLVAPAPVWPLMALSGMRGTARTFEVPAVQALMTDIVGPRHSPNAVGAYHFGLRLVSIVGGLGAGLLIEFVGPAAAFFVGGFAVLTGAAVVAGIRHAPPPNPGPSRSVWSDLVTGLRTMLEDRVVRLLLGLTLLIEVFAFSYHSLLPALADQVLHVGPTGLGTLTLFSGLGAIFGSMAMAMLGSVRRRGRVLLGVTFGYGGFILLMSTADHFYLALVLILGVGAMAAMFDGLQLVLMQANMPPAMRGRAVGGWVWAIGLGWFGPLILGGIGEAVGVPWAVATGGGVVVAVAILATAFVPGLRRA
jgi:MFS family permease